MLRKFMVTALIVVSIGGLAGCGRSAGERALTGGAIGAGGGALIGSVTGVGAGTGALIGGGGGAIGGAATAR